MSDQRLELASDTSESGVRDKIKELWQLGDLFHAFYRYPQRADARKVDRLAGILRKGVLAPASCDDGSVFSDLRLVVTGGSVPYDSLVFVHRFAAFSGLYTISRPGRMIVLIAPSTPFLTPQEMGPNWILLCRDEVYVRDQIPVENLIGLVVHPTDVEQVMAEFLPDLKRLGIPLYLYDGTVVWPEG